MESLREKDWNEFAKVVENHLKTYTVPQYGDKGEDQITDYTVGDCVVAIKKYANRYGTNQRSGQQLLDFMKIAHYAQCAWEKEKKLQDKPVETKVVFGGKVDQIHIEDAKDFLEKYKGKKIRILVED